MTSVTPYDYTLPKEYIAQFPIKPREQAKLMVLNRNTQTITCHHIFDLPNFFHKGDVVVINNTKVFKSRIFGTCKRKGFPPKKIEVFLVRHAGGNQWQALVRPGKICKEEGIIELPGGVIVSLVKKYNDGTVTIAFPFDKEKTLNFVKHYGHIPIPPYIKTIPRQKEYQTSYAKITGSVAAPTAGFHLTPMVRKTLQKKGVAIVEITLHVGLGTFLPIKTDNLEKHHMHSEWVSVAKNTADAIMRAKKEQRRIIAIGTTTVRTLEGIALQHNGILTPYEGDINCFIKPGFQFNIIDAMLTNFHLPKSTLLVLVSTFAGIGFIKKAYQEAIYNHYRFYSFGDAMLII